MALTVDEIEAAVRLHDEYFERIHPDLERYRDAYEDKFWEGDTSELSELATRVEINRMRPWVTSYVASLFYKQMKSVVEPDDVIRDTPADGDDLENGPDPGPIQAIIDRFYKLESVKAEAKRAFKVSLMYPECAIRLDIDPTIRHPIDQVYCELLPAWECIWDRKARSRRDSRYIGHCAWRPVEQVALKFGLDPKSIRTECRPDAVRDGLLSARPNTPDEEEAYVRVLEIYDLTTWVKVGEGDEEELVQGEYRCFLFGQKTDDDKDGIREVRRGPAKYHWPDGTPAPEIIPIVLDHLPEFPMHGISSAATVYEINRELNQISTYLAQAFRKDAARVWLYSKDRLDKDAHHDLSSGKDHALVGVEGESLENVVKALETQPVATSVMEYRRLLEEGLNDVQGTAPMTRGSPTKYVTAYESMRLNDYTETTLGMYKEGMDAALAELGALYLRVLAAAMDDVGLPEIKIRVLNQIQRVPRELLDHRWRVDLVDSANTPAKAMQKRQELQEASKPLIELATLATTPTTPPPVQNLAVKLHNLIVKHYDLPEELDFKRLMQEQPVVPPPPPELPPELLEGGGAMPGPGMAMPPDMAGMQLELPTAPVPTALNEANILQDAATVKPLME